MRNTLVDPLAALLNYGAPSAVGAIVLLGMLSVRSWAEMRKVMLAVVLVALAIFTLLACGNRLFLLLFWPNFSISEFVWWM